MFNGCKKPKELDLFDYVYEVKLIGKTIQFELKFQNLITRLFDAVLPTYSCALLYFRALRLKPPHAGTQQFGLQPAQ
jgi:hypothetical protein